MRLTAIAYLLPFTIQLPERTELECNVVIRRLTKEEKERKLSNRLLSMRQFDFESLKYCIEVTLDLEESPERTPEFLGEPTFRKFEEVFDKVLLSLRLFKSGSIGYNEFDLYQDVKYIATISRITYFWGRPYPLGEDQRIPFVIFYNQIKDLSPVDFTKIAMERFRIIYEREKEEDRLINLFIALESLFLKSEAELNYRLALNISCYLYNTYDERKQNFDKIKKAYGMRSKIIHGDSSSIDRAELIETLIYIENCFRETIKKIIVGKQGRDKNFFLDYVEERVLS